MQLDDVSLLLVSERAVWVLGLFGRVRRRRFLRFALGEEFVSFYYLLFLTYTIGWDTALDFIII